MATLLVQLLLNSFAKDYLSPLKSKNRVIPPFSAPNGAHKQGAHLYAQKTPHKTLGELALVRPVRLGTDAPDRLQPAKKRPRESCRGKKERRKKSQGHILPFKPRRCPRPQKEWI